MLGRLTLNEMGDLELGSILKNILSGGHVSSLALGGLPLSMILEVVLCFRQAYVGDSLLSGCSNSLGTCCSGLS